MPIERLTPPTIEWAPWITAQANESRQGQHKLFVGPTQSGKTTLARIMLRLRKYVVVFGTKPRDESLEKYIREGYRRINQWPPKPKELQPDADGNVRLLLWPEIKNYADLRGHREHYRRCLADVFTEGGWALGCDEGLWVASRKGLGLDEELANIAYGAASNNVSLHLCIQRPAGLSRVTWSSVSDAYVFHLGVTNDVRELASLGTYSPQDAATAIRNLEGHQFLRLPCRGGATWQISEVPKNWA
jgi:energy-coupling factor transporter ATP-binding protein EcfA2